MTAFSYQIKKAQSRFVSQKLRRYDLSGSNLISFLFLFYGGHFGKMCSSVRVIHEISQHCRNLSSASFKFI